MRKSQLAVLRALTAPTRGVWIDKGDTRHLTTPTLEGAEYVGWFIPNNSALTVTLRNVVKAGKRIGVLVEPNGVIKFFAEDK